MEAINAAIELSHERERQRKLLMEPHHYEVWTLEYRLRDALAAAVSALRIECCCGGDPPACDACEALTRIAEIVAGAPKAGEGKP